uniref:DNA/RNA helicase domain-containing protein n=1 Tax=Streptomyces sp. ND04-05B TaxID=3028693 RepID=UPI0029BFD93B|nr:DNA/RNA helicase domain-containing protein [Streptomyces sp. ND04-05B]
MLDRAGNQREQRCPVGNGHGKGPRPDVLVGGLSPAEGVGFEPTVTSLPRRFSRPWDSPSTPPLLPEVEIPWKSPAGPRIWARPWNSRADESTHDRPDVPARPFWATDPGGHDQVGCIYTAQGMEYAYNAVIMGGDLVRRGEQRIARPEKSQDPQLRGLPAHRYLQYALNTYRVLATRGSQGTRIYSTMRSRRTISRR